MSTILKALRRLEEDKRIQTARSLEEKVVEPAAQRRRRTAVWIATASLAGIGLAVLLVARSDVWRSGPAPAETKAMAASPAAAVAAPADPEPPVRIEDAPRPPPSAPVPLRPSSAASRIEVFENPGEVRREVQRLAGAPVEPAETPAQAAPSESPPAGAPPAPEPALVAKSAPAPAPDAKPGVEAVVEADAPPPTLAPVEIVQRKPRPDVSIRQISWHPSPERRAAVVDVEGESAPVRVAEGDTVAGFIVSEIGLSEVELVRDGVALRRRVGPPN